MDDSSDSESTARKEPGLFRLVAALALGVAVAGFVLWRSSLKRDIDTRIESLRASGLPTNWEELRHWPGPMPLSNNAALLYTQAFAHLESTLGQQSNSLELPPRQGPLQPETRAAIAAAVDKNRQALEIAYTAAQLPASRYPVEYGDGPNMLLPHLDPLKTLSQLLGFEAALEAEARNPGKAVRAFEASLAAARSLDTEPILLSQLMAMTLLSASCRHLERVLNQTALSQEHLASLQLQLASAEATNRLAVGLIGERALLMEFMRLAQEDSGRMMAMARQRFPNQETREPPPAHRSVLWRFTGFIDRDRAFFLRAMETNLWIAQTPAPASLSMTNHTREIDRQAARKKYFFSRMILPSLARLPNRDAAVRARLRSAIAAIAIERWRSSRSGDLPASLEALVPDYLNAVPADPFDGKSIKFKRLPQGYVVYSIGTDQRDNGGSEQPSRKGKSSGAPLEGLDITFVVER